MIRLQKLLVIIFVISFLQSCAINDKQQKQWVDSGQALINKISNKPLTKDDIANGLKEALKVSAERVVARVGKTNGYLNDKAIHIALPAKFKKVHRTLKKIGLEKYTNELEIKMNRAAETAAPKAKKLFWQAIKGMRLQDVTAIYKGEDDAATTYFKNKMTPELTKMIRPVINKTLADVGVVKSYNKTLKKYHSIPFVPKVNNDLTGYVMEKSIDGLFYYLAIEEAAIRKDPAKRTTKLLKRLFDK